MESTAPAYILIAIPSIVTFGEYQGELEGITFIAKSRHKVLRWFAINCGQFDRIFAELMPFDEAAALMESLRNGTAVCLPGAYHHSRFETGFHPLPGHLIQPGSHLQAAGL